jgi:hypothetical protein
MVNVEPQRTHSGPCHSGRRVPGIADAIVAAAKALAELGPQISTAAGAGARQPRRPGRRCVEANAWFA